MPPPKEKAKSCVEQKVKREGRFAKTQTSNNFLMKRILRRKGGAWQANLNRASFTASRPALWYTPTLFCFLSYAQVLS